MQTTVTSKGQVTIPKAVRDLLGLHAGSKVSFRRTADGRVELVPQEAAPEQSSFARFRGHAGAGMDTDAIMALTRDVPAGPDD